jgi:hypothetical protein
VSDAIEWEKQGRPAVVVATTQFEAIAKAMSAHFGLPDARRVVLPHPFGGTEAATLANWADAAVDDAIALLTGRR